MFVSLHEHGDLRGCIGTIAPVTGSVAAEIVRNGVAAASEDPRFPPVRPDELDALSYSVDVLLTPMPIDSIDELDPARYGVIGSEGWSACCCRTSRAWTRRSSRWTSRSAGRHRPVPDDDVGSSGSRWCATCAGERPVVADGRAVCGVCPHACALAEGRRGICRARAARGGRVVDENYGRVTSIALDPVEKKPLARFRPGSTVLSLGSWLPALPFCQNADIACAGRTTRRGASSLPRTP